MKTSTSMTLKSAIAAAICVLLLCSLTPVQARVTTIADLKSVSQLKTEAGLYDVAIREIGRIATISLVTPEDLKAARAIVAKHAVNLKYGRSKLVVLGLNDLTFTNAVKATLKDQTSAEAFFKELNADPKNIVKVSGAQSLIDRMKYRLASDTAMLRKVAERLKQAAVDIQAKYKPHHARTHVLLNAGDGSTMVRESYQNFESLQNSLVHYSLNAVVAVIWGPYVTAAFVGVIVFERLITFIGSEEARDELANCLKEAESDLKRCQELAAAKPFPENLATAALCDADYLLKAASCLLDAG